MAATDKKLVRSKSGLKIVAIAEDNESPFTVREPEWIPDNECQQCMECNTRFDFMHRRHHCRRCGKCFCSKCCGNKVPLPRMCFVDPVLQCDGCAQITKKENEFFDKHLKTLIAGGAFHVSDAPGDENVPIFLCKLTSDHRFLKFDGDEPVIDQVDMTKVESVQIMASGTDPQGNTVATGIMVRFRDSCGEMQSLKMVATETSQKRQAMLWVAAMQKAMKMLYENKTRSR